MDRTRASLRRARVYAAVLAVCAVYAAAPQSQRETLRGQAREAASHAADWFNQHFPRGPK